MTLSRRTMLGMTTAAALALRQTAGAQTVTPLAVAGVPEDSITPVLYAVQSGLYKRNGLDVAVTPERSGPAITAGVAGGAYQIGKSSITPLIQAHAKGLKIVIVAPAGVYTSAAPIDGMFVKTDSPIKTGADLNGKTFGVYGIGDIYTISARTWMEKNGGDPASLKFVELPISAMVEAIATGRVDAGSMNEPAVEVALDQSALAAAHASADVDRAALALHGVVCVVRLRRRSPSGDRCVREGDARCSRLLQRPPRPNGRSHRDLHLGRSRRRCGR